MSEKLNYHLSIILAELKTIVSEEISTTFQKVLIQRSPILNEHEVYLTTDELAINLKISKSHINKLRKKYKDFPVLSIDGSVRFKLSEVENFFIQIRGNIT